MHQTVLLKESIQSLNLKEGFVMVDGTLGAGGHSELASSFLGKSGKIIAFDLDKSAIERAKERLSKSNCQIYFVNENFKDLDKVLKDLKIFSVDAILLDLGFSSDQIEFSGRGFSFQKDEPLKMTLREENQENEFNAFDIVNFWEEEDIANVLYGYGEERFARRIAREITEQREKGQIKTTKQLAEIIFNAVPSFYRYGRIHPATKTFQALRIAVNNELGNIQEVLPKALAVLKPKGRLSVISFHSLEDRIVKNFFREMEKEGLGVLITKKPIAPDEEEVKNNRRARSAKLRVIEKI